MVHAFERPLLATEHSEFDRGAEAVAFALAARCGIALAGVLPLQSNPEYEMVAPQLAARDDAQAGAHRATLEAAARAQGIAFDLRVRRGPELFAEIIAEARERAADLIVIRRRGRRGLLANLLVGEMVGKVVAHAPCSVLVVPRAASMWSRRVVAGVDASSAAGGCVAQAATIAAECRLPLRLVVVAADAAARPAAERALADALASARRLHPDSSGELLVGRAHEVLFDAARRDGADLLVVARDAAGTQKTIGLAECAVLVHVNPTSTGRT